MIRLCSGSPTRAAILRRSGLEFLQEGCDFDEDSIIASSPKNFVYIATLGKYECCKKRYDNKIPLLVADTVVSCGGEILRKAKDEQEARAMLLRQSGNEVDITTCTIFSAKNLFFLDISVTAYIFEEFLEDDITRYISGNEWQGKAGACMVEGFCKKYIKEVYGLESNAMGLPIEKILPLVKRCRNE